MRALLIKRCHAVVPMINKNEKDFDNRTKMRCDVKLSGIGTRLNGFTYNAIVIGVKFYNESVLMNLQMHVPIVLSQSIINAVYIYNYSLPTI